MQMAQYSQLILNVKIPAFAEAASRRQANAE
jgi:hypothetical protein